jgi:sortase A
MKKIISVLLVGILCMAQAQAVFAGSYSFESGGDTLKSFGKPTSNDNPVSPDQMSQNERRNKDAAHLPPPYFYGSGDIPTEASSLYHDNMPGNAPNPNITGTAPTASYPYAPTSILARDTEPLYYADGSIGTLYIAKTGKTVKVYEGEQLDNLKKGAGHFASTSVWDGNVAICGHNRGAYPHFSFVKDLKTGDKITYTTRYGSRTYEVSVKEQISEYDHSKLGWSSENLLTLITCVADTPELRWAAVLREAR